MTQTRNDSTSNVAGREQARLFFGIRIPADTTRALERWQHATLVGAGRIVPPEHLHVTLAFLGHRPTSELDALRGALHAVAARAARPLLTVRRYRETRSVGMLVLDDEQAQATAFALDLHERLETLGVYRRERRPWLPHLTVLRFRTAPRLRPPLPELEPFSPSDAALYHSVLRPTGAQYDVLETAALGG